MRLTAWLFCLQSAMAVPRGAALAGACRSAHVRHRIAIAKHRRELEYTCTWVWGSSRVQSRAYRVNPWLPDTACTAHRPHIKSPHHYPPPLPRPTVHSRVARAVAAARTHQSDFLPAFWCAASSTSGLPFLSPTLSAHSSAVPPARAALRSPPCSRLLFHMLSSFAYELCSVFGAGTITKEALAEALALIQGADTDGDGALSFAEFKQRVVDARQTFETRVEEDSECICLVNNVFDAADKNNDEKVNVKELSAIISELRALGHLVKDKPPSGVGVSAVSQLLEKHADSRASRQLVQRQLGPNKEGVYKINPVRRQDVASPHSLSIYLCQTCIYRCTRPLHALSSERVSLYTGMPAFGSGSEDVSTQSRYGAPALDSSGKWKFEGLPLLQPRWEGQTAQERWYEVWGLRNGLPGRRRGPPGPDNPNHSWDRCTPSPRPTFCNAECKYGMQHAILALCAHTCCTDRSIPHLLTLTRPLTRPSAPH